MLPYPPNICGCRRRRTSSIVSGGPHKPPLDVATSATTATAAVRAVDRRIPLIRALLMPVFQLIVSTFEVFMVSR